MAGFFRQRSVPQYKCRCYSCKADSYGEWRDTEEAALNYATSEEGWQVIDLDGREVILCGKCVSGAVNQKWPAPGATDASR